MEIYLLVFITIATSILLAIYNYIKDRKIKNSILDREFMSVNFFEQNWIASKYGNKGLSGFKYNDQPGCYVILVFNHAIIDSDYSKYENVYIGQSVNMCQRVHNHFNGKGNGDIYADIKYGKYVYVQLNPCFREGLNNLEKKLIRVFNATRSYNKTRGGSKVVG